MLLDKAAMLPIYAKNVPKWSIPDYVLFVDALPVGGTGKIVKKQLRDDFAAGKLK